jgi:hypothetical protein
MAKYLLDNNVDKPILRERNSQIDAFPRRSDQDACENRFTNERAQDR